MRQGLELPNQVTLASLLQAFVSLVKSISHVVKGDWDHLDKTVKLVKEIPFVPSAMVWWSLLSACVATHAILLNIYANARRRGNVASIRKSMKRKGVRKEQGLSWDANYGGVHYFSVGDISHLDTMIKGMLEWLNVNPKNEDHVFLIVVLFCLMWRMLLRA
ncbi:hypothetical protein OIU84_023797 [Salix udensis]|uniref:Uncharacterized protein n=1 Tax=Salix udensis TaxID=889485 RepID=A0AAD6KU15_9ROSI|nr:hypothetical protein OIU84_023797 [Salix udensis]